MTDSPFDDVLNPPKSNKGGTDVPFSEEELFGTTGDEEEKQYEFSESYINPDSPWESFTKKQRLKILLLSSLPILLQPLATTMAVPTLQIIADDFETKYAYILLTVAGFNVLAGIFPMFYGPISDIFGRKLLWYITLPAFAIFAVCSGFSGNVGMLIFFRSLLGAVACSPIIIGAGIVTDVFPPEMQGKALGAQVDHFFPSLICLILGLVLFFYFFRAGLGILNIYIFYFYFIFILFLFYFYFIFISIFISIFIFYFIFIFISEKIEFIEMFY